LDRSNHERLVKVIELSGVRSSAKSLYPGGSGDCPWSDGVKIAIVFLTESVFYLLTKRTLLDRIVSKYHGEHLDLATI
jgi:hypothetical protein